MIHLEVSDVPPKTWKDLEPVYDDAIDVMKEEAALIDVNWGVDRMTNSSTTLLAYMKTTPASGGWVLIADGRIADLTLEEFNQLGQK